MALFSGGIQVLWDAMLHLWVSGSPLNYRFQGRVVQEDVLIHEDEDITIIRNVGTHSPNATTSHLRRLES
jgi:hypothetical protein